jgi:hypothetical protein
MLGSSPQNALQKGAALELNAASAEEALTHTDRERAQGGDDDSTAGGELVKNQSTRSIPHLGLLHDGCTAGFVAGKEGEGHMEGAVVPLSSPTTAPSIKMPAVWLMPCSTPCLGSLMMPKSPASRENPASPTADMFKT